MDEGVQEEGHAELAEGHGDEQAGAVQLLRKIKKMLFQSLGKNESTERTDHKQRFTARE